MPALFTQHHTALFMGVAQALSCLAATAPTMLHTSAAAAVTLVASIAFGSGMQRCCSWMVSNTPAHSCFKLKLIEVFSGFYQPELTGPSIRQIWVLWCGCCCSMWYAAWLADGTTQKQMESGSIVDMKAALQDCQPICMQNHRPVLTSLTHHQQCLAPTLS